jgi:hypothetical protein
VLEAVLRPARAPGQPAEEGGECRDEQRQAGRNEPPLARHDARWKPRGTGQQRCGNARVPTLDVMADRGAEKHAGALCRQRLVHEPVDEAVADEPPQPCLVLATTGDDDHDVRELRDDLLDQGRRLDRDGTHVDDQHAATAGHQEVDGLLRGACTPDRVALADRIADRLEQRHLGRQHDDVDQDA